MLSQLTQTFVENVKDLLGDRTAYYLAKESGLAQSSTARLLNGDITPTLETVELVARALKVSPHILLMKNPKHGSKIPNDILIDLETQDEVFYEALRGLLKAVQRRSAKRK